DLAHRPAAAVPALVGLAATAAAALAAGLVGAAAGADTATTAALAAALVAAAAGAARRGGIALRDHAAHADLERQQQLVALEEAGAGVLVHLVRVPVVDGGDARAVRVLWCELLVVKAERGSARLGGGGLGVNDGRLEQQRVGVERELVHRVDGGEVVQHKVE